VLRHIRSLLTSLPKGHSSWVRDALGGPRRWIRDHKELICAAAAATGLPPDLIAGIAWQEVGGRPYVLDGIIEAARRAVARHWRPSRYLPRQLGRDPDRTSYGPMAVQLRRGAEVLGYDPVTLIEPQRAEVRSALKDPAQSVFIAAMHLAILKAQSAFADVPVQDLTVGQYQELAARYNGGPSWRGAAAQAYGRAFVGHLRAAGEALR
jgi:soluble lytic murein transglycosylase-like protein